MFQVINHRICQKQKLLDQGEAIKIPMEGYFFLTLAQLCNLISLEIIPFRVFKLFIKIISILYNFCMVYADVGRNHNKYGYNFL